MWEGASRHKKYLPLTKNQLPVFAECEANKNSIQYNMPAYFSFSRNVMDATRLEDAIRRVSDKHRAFSIRIVKRGSIPDYAYVDGCEVYQVLTDEPLVIDFVHMEHDFEDRAQTKAYFQAKVRPFELFQDRLYRIEIVETPRRLHLFFDMHHIISDGYSLRILAADITRILSGEPIPSERLTFSEYIAHRLEMGTSGSNDRAYAEELMAGMESFKYPYRLPKGAVQHHRVARIQRDFAMEDIAGYCSRNSLTQSSYFHASLLLVLYLLTGERPFIATTYSGRGECPEALMRTVGFFARSVPVVWKEDGDVLSMGDLRPDGFIRNVQAQVMDSCSRDGLLYSDLSLQTDVLLTFQGEVGMTFINQFRATPLDREYPVFPMHLEVKPNGADCEIILSYDTAHFSQTDMILLFDAYERILHRMLSARALKDTPLVRPVTPRGWLFLTVHCTTTSDMSLTRCDSTQTARFLVMPASRLTYPSKGFWCRSWLVVPVSSCRHPCEKTFLPSKRICGRTEPRAVASRHR
jgi:hypothetical protein